jgi:D-lactate dehydrogenase
VCPSRNVSTTPRQRIALRREMARQAPGSPVLKALARQYEYDAIQTCAVDGSCMEACPVGIDTGRLIKGLRVREHGEHAERVALEVARRYALAERGARTAVRAGGLLARWLGDRRLQAAGAALRRRPGSEPVPEWTPSIPRAAPARLPDTECAGAAAVYLPSCLNRIFGNARGEPPGPTVPQALLALSVRAGLPLWIPPDVAGHCCAVPWSSKGYQSGRDQMAACTRVALQRWTDGGRLPVVTDASSCAQGLIDELELDGIDVSDSIDWVHDRLLEQLAPRHKLPSVLVHPTCSAGHLGLTGKLVSIAEKVADQVIIPAATGCCGMGGDRGWLHPELPASALRDTELELQGREFDACVSSNRTCELALHEHTGRPFRSFVLMLEELTRP